MTDRLVTTLLEIARLNGSSASDDIQDAQELARLIWHMVDQIVRGLLSGEKWVVDRYALGSKYNCENIRSELVKHIPKEVQDSANQGT